ncbi:hypothetical protein ACQP1G_22170 [Nocardia sp. CA-107356]|uniref:hypothetical protein n=1 Tax=Nocardia sp. CA-107356 TaxID=3239972 RepID=UPI003D91FEA3
MTATCPLEHSGIGVSVGFDVGVPGDPLLELGEPPESGAPCEPPELGGSAAALDDVGTAVGTAVGPVVGTAELFETADVPGGLLVEQPAAPTTTAPTTSAAPTANLFMINALPASPPYPAVTQHDRRITSTTNISSEGSIVFLAAIEQIDDFFAQLARLPRHREPTTRRPALTGLSRRRAIRLVMGGSSLAAERWRVSIRSCTNRGG